MIFSSHGGMERDGLPRGSARKRDQDRASIPTGAATLTDRDGWARGWIPCRYMIKLPLVVALLVVARMAQIKAHAVLGDALVAHPPRSNDGVDPAEIAANKKVHEGFTGIGA